MKDELDDDSVFIQFTSLNKLKNPDLLLKNPMNISNFYLLKYLMIKYDKYRLFILYGVKLEKTYVISKI